MAEHLESGNVAERLALSYLTASGLRHVASNYRCRYGEIDLVMAERSKLIIVEIRYRRSTRVMDPVASITPSKCRRIVRTTQHFLQRHDRWRGYPVRFDVIGLDGPLDNANMNWIRGAFTMDDLFDH
jgi:putative endonuclease